MKQPGMYPTQQSLQNRQSRMKKRKIILVLRLLILVMVFLILGLTIFLVGRAISSSATLDTKIPAGSVLASTTSSASNGSAASTDASALASDLSGTPTAAALTPTTVPSSTEKLQQAAVVDSFFGPLPVAESVVPVTHNEIHAIYLGAAANLDSSIALAKTSEINAFVIDLKESNGIIFNSTNALATELGAVKSYYNLSDVIKKCHDNGIKVIGRIVCFKDPELAKQKPEYSIQDANGNSLYFKNEGSNAFANPYNKIGRAHV